MNVNSTLYHVTLATSVVNVYVDPLADYGWPKSYSPKFNFCLDTLLPTE